MAEEEKNDKWIVPANISYDNYILILRTLYQLNADSKPVVLDDLAKQTQLQKPTVSADMSFLKSIDVIESDTKNGYKLTSFGKDYCKAIYTGDKELIEKSSSEIIEKSHLKSLLDNIKIKPDVTLESLYGFIKGQGRFSDGLGISGMSTPYATAGKTILKIFKDANKLPENINLDTKKIPSSNTGVKSTMHSKSFEKKRKKQPGEDVNEAHNSTLTSSLAKLIVPGIGNVEINDKDTLQFAESFLKLIKNKIESRSDSEDSSKNNAVDEQNDS